MNQMSKDKRNKLILVILGTLIVLAGMWFGLIKTVEDRLVAISSTRDNARSQLEEVTRSIASADQLSEELTSTSAWLKELEQGMASGDLYSWAINTIRQFKIPYKVEIPQFSQIDGPKPTTMLPKFPYQQATITIGGTALFHDFGRFLADFENEFPYARVQGVTIEPAPSDSSAAGSAEKLQFRLDIVALVKPTAS